MKKNRLFLLLLLVLLAFGQTAWAQYSGGDGTANDPYQISTEADWIALCSNVNNSNSTYEGNFFKLMADITVEETFNTPPTKMVGISENVNFRGTFDGNGHTLTVNYLDNNSEDYSAPFRYIRNATIKNLHVAGSITKIPNKYAGGLVGTAFGTCHISHCRSSVEIVCASGDHSSGGFIGELGTSSDPDDTYIDNCLFDGILQGLSSYSWGGFIGWVEDEPDAYISNCLFKPAQVTVTSDGNKTFARGSDIHISNCYYTYFMNDEQGATNASGMSKTDLRAAVGDGWEIVTENGNEMVVPIMAPRDLNGEGTTASPYLIATAEDWEDLSINVILGETYSGKHFLMTDDISVTNMLGTYSGWDIYKTFNGSFNGGGHTLTVNYTTDAEFCGPFRYTHGATIKNLITTGTIITTKQHAGGVVGRNGTGKLTLENVKSDVTINSTYNGSAEHGGLVGYAINVDLIGCVFAGSVLGENSTSCGGLIGWKTGTTGSSANLTDCLFAPANMTVGNTNAYTFAGLPSDSMANFTNCYYTEPFGTEQGKQAYSITCANNDITLNFAGAATENEVSGITSYANNHGFLYNDGTGSTLIAGNGDNVSLKLTAPADYIINSATYTPAGGTATEMAFANGGYSFTMPDTNVVINADVTVCGKILVDEANPEWSEDFEDDAEAAGYVYDPSNPNLWTGVTPACWEYEMYTSASQNQIGEQLDTVPQVYRSFNTTDGGHYSLRMHYKSLLAMPELDENVDLGKIRLSLYVRQSFWRYQLQIGVLTADGTFYPVAVVNNPDKTKTYFECGFEAVKDLVGEGRRIAFKNFGSNENDPYAVNYLDDITLTYVDVDSLNCLVSPGTVIDFEGMTTLNGATGVEPKCWEVITPDVELTSTTKPQLYRGFNSTEGGHYSLRMMNRCVYAMPEFDEEYPIENLTMTLKLRQPNSLYRLQVGVVDEQGVFTVVKTLKSSTTMEAKTVSFANCPVNGRIAFRNTLVPGTGMSTDYLDYSYNYIDDINFVIGEEAKAEVSIAEAMEADLDIVVYPNPTKDVVNVECTMNNVQCSGIEIIDVYGKIITTVDQTATQINVSGLAAGMYFVRVTTDRGVVTKPFVKR